MMALMSAHLSTHRTMRPGSLCGPLDAVTAGRFLLLDDDTSPRGGGSLVIAANAANAETINFMAHHGRGIICLALPPDRAVDLGLALLPKRGPERRDTAFTQSIEARVGISTGISASDRAITVAAAISAGATREDIATPGHVFPLIAKPGGLIASNGHTEASLDLMRLAGLELAAVFCRVISDDGRIAGNGELEALADQFDLEVVRFSDIARHLWANVCELSGVTWCSAPVGGSDAVGVFSCQCDLDDRVRYIAVKGLDRFDRLRQVPAFIQELPPSSCRQESLRGEEAFVAAYAASKLADVAQGVAFVMPEASNGNPAASAEWPWPEMIDIVVLASMAASLGIQEIRPYGNSNKDGRAQHLARHLREMSYDPPPMAAAFGATDRARHAVGGRQ